VERVRGEHSWPEDYRVDGRGGEQSLNFSMKTAQRVRLLEERVWRLMWRREVDDAPALPRRRRFELRDDRRGRGDGRSPYEECCRGAVEGRVERLGDGEITYHDLGAGGECRLIRPTRERAHRHAGTKKLVDDETPHAARGAGYEDLARRRARHERTVDR
jgi:hypothetical protein